MSWRRIAIFADFETVAAAMHLLRAGAKRLSKNFNESDDDIRKGVTYATGNDWSWKDGCKHGASADQRRAPLRSLRQVAECGERVGPRQGGWSRLACGFSEEARETPGDMVN